MLSINCLRLRLFWLQTNFENDFLEKWVFGWFGKLGQTENNFRRP